MKFTQSFAILALPFFVAAGPLDLRSDVCNSGSVNCCEHVQKGSSALSSVLNGLLGTLIPIEAVLEASVGITCSPVTVVGLGQTECNQQVVCCTGNSFNNNLINLGCSPINVL